MHQKRPLARLCLSKVLKNGGTGILACPPSE
jgi:hypothetical protein